MVCAYELSVRVKIIGGEGKPAPGQLESKEVLKHKKNPDVGTKTTYYADEIFVEQADAATFNPDEEVRSLRGLPLSLLLDFGLSWRTRYEVGIRR